jgi:Xaa-Pro aminopeptidase
MRKFCLLVFQFFLFASLFSQDAENLPADYLSKAFHADRRNALRQLMPPNSMAVIFAYPEQVFSLDVNYFYHQNPDLYYFSGYNEPNSVLLIFKDRQTTPDNKQYNELIFIQKKDPLQELWTGRRMGVDKVKLELGFDMVFEGSSFKSFPIDFSKFDKILFEGLQVTEDDPSDSADLHDLVETVKKKAGITISSKMDENLLNGLFANANMQNLHYFITYMQNQLNAGTVTADHALMNGVTVQDILDIKDSTSLNAIKQKIGTLKFNTGLYDQYVSSLRQIKTPEEITLLKRSVDISSIAHVEVMKAIQPGMSEHGLQAFLSLCIKNMDRK